MHKAKLVFTTTLFLLAIFLLVGYTACKDSCKDASCLNGSSCKSGVCICPTGYTGEHCEKMTCVDSDCKNGGICRDGSCKCASGYEGTYCEKLVAERFYGTWTGSTNCGPSNSNITLVITKGITDLDVLITETSFNSTKSFRGTITEGKTVNIPMQMQSASVYIQGTMAINGNTLSFDQTLSTNSGNPQNCIATCIK